MKRLFLGALLLALVLVTPIPAMARVGVSVSITLPPIVFAAPPALIVLPETYVYVVPDVDMDIFFYNGWWWRPWEGRWYRSRYYDRSWARYRSVPSFYREIPSDWRDDYRDHRWRGHQWNYQPIPHQQVQRNWRSWEKSRHWEKQQTWNVQGLQPQKRSQQPYRKAQPRQSQPREARPGQSQQQHQKGPGPRGSREIAEPQQRQEAGPQRREDQQQHPQEQKGEHERGKGEKQDRR
jgi:hypothetical protein